MTAITPTELSVTDIPCNRSTGAGKRRVLIAIRCTSTGTSDTLDLSTYVPNLADIEGISMETLDSATNAGAKNTWSTTTITTAGHSGGGLWELLVMGNMTDT